MVWMKIIFKRRFGITDEDLITIHKLIDRIKRGKTLTKVSNSNIRGTSQAFGSTYSAFLMKTVNYDNANPTFEIMNEIALAMDAYNRKMKKHQKRHKWKQSTDSRVWEDPSKYGNLHPEGCVQDELDRYYT